MFGILVFGLEMVVQFSSPRNWVFEKCSGSASINVVLVFRSKGKMDNTKEIAKTYQGLGSNYCALKTIHDKKYWYFGSSYFGLHAARLVRGKKFRSELGSHLPHCDFPPSPHLKHAHAPAQLDPLSHRPMTIRSCKKL
jgi:hypothetical protein